MNQSKRKRNLNVAESLAPYRRNKKAFDSVIIYYKRMDRPMLKPLGAINPEAGKSKGSSYRNPVKPSLLELWCDVQIAIRAVLPKGVTYEKFETVYFQFDSEDETERNTHAYKMFGGRCHSIEQRVGAEFVRRGIYPLGKYLNPPRPGHRHCS